MKDITFEQLKSMLLYRKIVKWTKDEITLDNGVSITIQCTEQDCCAWASGEFSKLELDAAITDVTEIDYSADIEEYDTRRTFALVKLLHNQEPICEITGEADGGNGGYYYSIASFIVSVPNDDECLCCYFVGDSDGYVEE
jgi:hypothetical protein